jgi:branched-chain amino acid transport system substrate-binding protein
VLGRKFTVVTADNASNSNQSLQAGQEVLSKGAQIMLTSCSYELAAPATRLANSKNVLVWSYCAGEPPYSRQGPGGGGPLTFDMGDETNGVGASMAQAGYKRGFRRAWLLVDDSLNYPQEESRFFTARWDTLPGTSIAGTQFFKNSDPSIASQITAFKALSPKPDVIVLSTYLPGGATAVRQIRAAGINTPILTGDGMDGPSWLKAVPHLSNFYQTVLASIYGDDPRPQINAFFKRLRTATGQAPQGSYAVFGYSIIQALAKAIRETGTTNGPALAAALEKFRSVPLLDGPLSLTKSLHFDAFRPEVVVQIQNGKPSYLMTIHPTNVPNPYSYRPY